MHIKRKVYSYAGGLCSVFFPALSDKILEVHWNNALEDVLSSQSSNIFLAGAFRNGIYFLADMKHFWRVTANGKLIHY